MIKWKTYKNDRRYLDIKLMEIDFPNDYFKCYLEEVEDVEIYYKGTWDKLSVNYTLTSSDNFPSFNLQDEFYKFIVEDLAKQMERALINRLNEDTNK